VTITNFDESPLANAAAWARQSMQLNNSTKIEAAKFLIKSDVEFSIIAIPKINKKTLTNAVRVYKVPL
jgi:hypothetical protein